MIDYSNSGQKPAKQKPAKQVTIDSSKPYAWPPHLTYAVPNANKLPKPPKYSANNKHSAEKHNPNYRGDIENILKQQKKRANKGKPYYDAHLNQWVNTPGGMLTTTGGSSGSRGGSGGAQTFSGPSASQLAKQKAQKAKSTAQKKIHKAQFAGNNTQNKAEQSLGLQMDKSDVGSRIRAFGKKGTSTYYVEVKNSKGAWTSDPAAVDKTLAEYKLASGTHKAQFAGNKTQNSQESALAAQAEYSTLAKQIRTVGKVGSSTSYIEVLGADGKWSSNAAAVDKFLSDFKTNTAVYDASLKNKIASDAAVAKAAADNAAYVSAARRVVRKNNYTNAAGKSDFVHGISQQQEKAYYAVDKNHDGSISNAEARAELKDHLGPSQTAADKRQDVLARNVLAGKPADSPLAPVYASESVVNAALTAYNAANPVQDKVGVTVPGHTGLYSTGQAAVVKAADASAANAAKVAVNVGDPTQPALKPYVAPSRAISDANLNGNVTKAEQKAFYAVDRNNNGRISANEARKELADNTGKAQTATNSLQDQIAVNRGGGIVGSEARKLADTNNNGDLTKKEIKTFNAVDANNDGKITKKEAKAELRDQIGSHQSNADKSQDALAKQYLASAKANGGTLKADANANPAQFATTKQKVNK